MRKLIFVPVILLFALVFMAASGGGNPEREKVLVSSLFTELEYRHFNPEEMNEKFSQKLYDLFLERMDQSKRFFTAEDEAQFSVHRNDLHLKLKNGDMSFFEKVYNTYTSRMDFVEKAYQDGLNAEMDFSKDESFETDPKKVKYASGEEALRERWRVNMKYAVLDELSALEKQQADNLKNDKIKDTLKVLDRATLEKKALAKIKTNYDRWIKRLRKQDRSDVFDVFMNSITGCYDPHTGYFAPREKENFDIRMSGKLEGIGAQLSEDNGYTKVTRIVPGAPSWKQGELKEGDYIIKVAQKGKEAVDVYNMDLDSVVTMIRGPKGTDVILTAKKPDGTIKDIQITRDVVVMEESYAKSTIINDEKNKTHVGYIYLPSFYADFDDPSSRRCSRDIKEELRKLKAEKVDAIILDLRYNGGGSLTDVVDMGGYFIKDGPIVQVKSRDAEPTVMSDRDLHVEYAGPLVIMVNSYSASASEILAAAMQDYGRAIIVGDASTFGKGTVQRFIDLDQTVSGKGNMKPLGAVKMTMQKFYRVNGGSTQLRGVVPDIILPDLYNYIPVGEREEDYPMEWTEIAAAQYKPTNSIKNLSAIKRKSAARVKKSEVFKLIDERARWTAEQRNNSVWSLNHDKFVAREAEIDALNKKYEKSGKTVNDFKFEQTKADQITMLKDTTQQARVKEWHKTLSEDPYLGEVMSIVKDMTSEKGGKKKKRGKDADVEGSAVLKED